MDYAAAIRDRLPAAWRGDEFGQLLGTLEGYLPEEELEGIVAAYEVSAKAHHGQQRLVDAVQGGAGAAAVGGGIGLCCRGHFAARRLMNNRHAAAACHPI